MKDSSVNYRRIIFGTLLTIFSISSSATAVLKWRPVGPGPFGAMFGVGFHPKNPEIIAAGVDMGNAFITRDGGNSWEVLGQMGKEPFAQPGYRGTWGIKFDHKNPDIVWIGSTHGLYKSEDRGKTWQLKLGGDPTYQVCPIETDPTDNNIVYAGSGQSARKGGRWCTGNIYKTIDGGKTWTVSRPGGEREKDSIKIRSWSKIAVDPQSRYVKEKGHLRVYVVGQGGIFVSEDAGGHWTSIEEKIPGGVINLSGDEIHTCGACDLVLVPGRKEMSVIFATFQARETAEKSWLGGVYRSGDGGKTWSEKNSGLEKILSPMALRPDWADLRYSMIAVSPSNPKVLYWGWGCGIFKSTDQGETWVLATNSNTEWYKGPQVPDFDGKEVYWLLSRHGGNYKKTFFGSGIGGLNGLTVSPSNSDYVAYTDNAGIGLSKDGGRTWDEPTFEYGEAYKPDKFGDRPPMALTHKVRSRGVQLIVPQCLDIDPFNGKNIAAGYLDLGLRISRDGGTWWEWGYEGVLAGERNNGRTVVYDPAVKDRLYLGTGGWGKSGKVYQSNDGGKTFQIIGIPQLTKEAEQSGKNYNINDLAVDFNSPAGSRAIWAATSAGIYKTTDGGKNWIELSGGLAAGTDFHRLAVDSKNPRRLYAGTNPTPEERPVSNVFGLYRSEDGGGNWVQLAPDKLGAIKTISICKERPRALYVISLKPGEVGFWAPAMLWRSDDYGETWKRSRTWEEMDNRFPAFAAVHPKNPEIVYGGLFTSDVTKGPVGLFRSTDGGKRWQEIDEGISFSLGSGRNNIIFDPKNSRHIFLLHSSGIYEGWDNNVPN